MAFQSPWDDAQDTAARTGRRSGANPYGPPGVKTATAGAPANPPNAPDPGGGGGGGANWQGYTPGYLGQTGGAQPGSGWGYYYANNGRATGAGALNNLAQNFNYDETDQSSLSKAGMGLAERLINEGDPTKLADKFYQRGENTAIRAGQAAREQELSDVADSYAQRGMLASGGAQGAAADVRRKSSQARLAALDKLNEDAMQFGESASQGRLAGGMPWENSDLGRRTDNTGWRNRAIDKRTELAAAAASAAGAGQERIIEIPGYGEVPESMIPYLMEFGGMA